MIALNVCDPLAAWASVRSTTFERKGKLAANKGFSAERNSEVSWSEDDTLPVSLHLLGEFSPVQMQLAMKLVETCDTVGLCGSRNRIA